MSAELYLSPLNSTFHFAPKTFVFAHPATLTLDGHIHGMRSSSSPSPENAFFPSVALAIDQALIHYDGSSFTLRSVDYHSDPVCVNGMLLGDHVHTLSDGDKVTFGRYRKHDHCFEVDCGVIVRVFLPAPRTTNWPGIRQLLEHLRQEAAQDIHDERVLPCDQASAPSSDRSQTSVLTSVLKSGPLSISSSLPDSSSQPLSLPPSLPSSTLPPFKPSPLCTSYGDLVQASTRSTPAASDRRSDPSTWVPRVSPNPAPPASVTSPSSSVAAHVTPSCTVPPPFGSVVVQSDSSSMSTAELALSRVAAAWATARRWMGTGTGPFRHDSASCALHGSLYSGNLRGSRIGAPASCLHTGPKSPIPSPSSSSTLFDSAPRSSRRSQPATTPYPTHPTHVLSSLPPRPLGCLSHARHPASPPRLPIRLELDDYRSSPYPALTTFLIDTITSWIPALLQQFSNTLGSFGDLYPSSPCTIPPTIPRP
ncbi:hypothetical protein CF326_g5603 [Tilletia indica]|nr:hypothetical protein CF326_g5603 [Tilletia indica]